MIINLFAGLAQALQRIRIYFFDSFVIIKRKKYAQRMAN